MRIVFTFLVAALGWLPATASSDPYLLMAEEAGCYWCARWDKEISAIYPKTPEGKAAPLRRYDITQGPPEGITLRSRVRYTPTFILVSGGRELMRLEGYPGEDFFWGALLLMLEETGHRIGESG